MLPADECTVCTNSFNPVKECCGRQPEFETQGAPPETPRRKLPPVPAAVPPSVLVSRQWRLPAPVGRGRSPGIQYPVRMCGRFTQKLTWRELHDLYSLLADAPPDNMRPRWNGAPT